MGYLWCHDDFLQEYQADVGTELRSFLQRVSVCLIWLLILPIIPLSSMDLLMAAGLVYRLVLPLLKLATMKEA